MMPVCFAFKPIVVKMTPVGKVCMVFPVKAGMIVIVIGAVVIVAMPCRISIISISRISRFIDADLHMDLCAGRIGCQRSCYDHGENK